MAGVVVLSGEVGDGVFVDEDAFLREEIVGNWKRGLVC